MDKEKFGIFIGRFQSFHLGHQSVIDQIITDGLTPIIFVGSSQEFNTEKNPYHVQDRMKMIQLVYPDIKVFAIQDKSCWDEWHTLLTNSIKLVVTTELSDITMYCHDKEEDRHDKFTFRGKDYFNEFYSKMYEIDGMSVKELVISDIPVRAKLIREDLEANKHFLDPRVYRFLSSMSLKVGTTYSINAIPCTIVGYNYDSDYSIKVESPKGLPMSYRPGQLKERL